MHKRGAKMNTDPSRRKVTMLFCVFLLCVFRVSYLGFRYTPYLDDFVQYYYYPSFSSPFRSILLGGARTMLTRPLAALADLFFWSGFKSFLGAAVFIVSALFGLSAVFFFVAFDSLGFEITPIFFLVYAFTPLNIEGVYWLSASSRIVVSLFFTSAALLALVRGKTFLYASMCFVSVWFYEQTAVLSLAMLFLISISFRSLRTRHSSLCAKLLPPMLCACMLFIYYSSLAPLSDNSERLQLAQFSSLVSNVSTQSRLFAELFFRVNCEIILHGASRGLSRILRDGAYLQLFILAVLCVLIAYSAKYTKSFSHRREKLLLGAFLTIVPLLPFFATMGNLPNVRSCVPSLLGIALIADAAIPKLFRSMTPAFVCLCLFVFSIATVSEVCDYNQTASSDLALAQKIANEMPLDAEQISVDVKTPDYYPQNSPIRDHISSMTGTDWGVTGIVRTLSGNRKVTVIVNKKNWAL